MKWLKYLVAMSGILLITQFVTTSSVYAISEYDDIIQPISSLKVQYTGLSDVDMTNNYMGYFKNTITTNVAQYECQENGNSSANPANCNQIINDSLDNGDWLITQSYSSYPTDNSLVMGQFCDEKITSLEGYAYPNATARYLYGSTTDSANCVSISVRYQPYYSGMHLAVVGQINHDISHDAVVIGSEYVSGGVWHRNDSQYLFTASPAYPDGYAGAYPSSDYTPITTSHSGTVDCGGKTPVAMTIYQPGNNGAATLVQQSLGTALWNYSLTSDPYSFTIDCGGTLAHSYANADPATTSGDWTCDVYGDPPYYCSAS